MKKQGRFEAKPRVSTQKKRRNSKNKLLLSLVSSIVSMILCCTMFLGTTLAWFTDSVTSAGNQITIGELEVGFLLNGQSLEADPRLRTPAPKVFDNSFRWAPDRFEARSLTIQNSGNLDIQYVLNLLLEADDASVAKYFDVYVYTGTGELITGTLDKDSRDGWEKVGNLAEMFTGGINVLEGELKAPDLMSTDTTTSKTVGFALHMLPDVKTEEDLKKIAGQSMTFGIKLNAYQIDTPEDERKDPTATTAAAVELAEDEAPAEEAAVQTTEATEETVEETTEATEETVEETTEATKETEEAAAETTKAPEDEPEE